MHGVLELALQILTIISQPLKVSSLKNFVKMFLGPLTRLYGVQYKLFVFVNCIWLLLCLIPPPRLVHLQDVLKILVVVELILMKFLSDGSCDRQQVIRFWW